MPTLRRLICAIALIGLACSGPETQTADAGGGGGGGGGAGAGGGGGSSGPQTVADLRADVNRDGVVDLTAGAADDVGEDSWDATHGAIFLANIDDDQKLCSFDDSTSDAVLATCNDAADEVVNGPDDLLDLAPLQTVPWPDAPEGTTGTLTVSTNALTRVRLFLKVNGDYLSYLQGTKVGTSEVRTGVSFAIEAKDIVRDANWDGYVDLTWAVTPGNAADQAKIDVVRMRISPVMLFDHLQSAETVFVSNIVGDGDSSAFQSAISQASSAAGIANPVYKYPTDDQWNQDYFENGYMAMPAAGGGQHVIRVAYRSANIYNSPTSSQPLRFAGRIAYAMRGKDHAALQQFDPSANPDMDSLNSFGNTETIPPYALGSKQYPMGRVYRGSVPSFHPDVSFSKMLEAQKVQPPVYVDTSWLLVGHVDETVSFLKVNSPRGWIVLVNDVALAKQMLEDQVTAGNGSVKVFEGMSWYDDWGNPYPAETTISGVLADTDVMNESASSAVEVAAQLDILKTETGITDAEIVKVPFLHQRVSGYSLAYQPGTVNLLVLSDHVVAVPAPHGPVINNVDIFKKQLEDALSPYGYSIQWIEDWDLYHALAGEVHCGTNAARTIPSQKWWETGR